MPLVAPREHLNQSHLCHRSKYRQLGPQPQMRHKRPNRYPCRSCRIQHKCFLGLLEPQRRRLLHIRRRRILHRIHLLRQIPYCQS